MKIEVTLLFAHRGSSATHPENTMAAFIAAYKEGADGIELDVQLTKDEQIVVIHDPTIDRTTNGKGRVMDYTLSELKKFKIKKNRFRIFTETSTIPTLIEVFDWFITTNLICNIELKNNKYPYKGLEEKVIQLIREYKVEDRIIFSTFNEHSIRHLAEIAPNIKRAILTNKRWESPWEYVKSIDANDIHPKHTRITTKNIIATMNKAIEVRPYTVNSSKEIKKFIDIHCSAIITDYPARARKIMNRRKKA